MTNLSSIEAAMGQIIADVRRLAQHAPPREPAPPAESEADKTRRFWSAYNSLSPADQASYRRYLGIGPSPPASDSFTGVLTGASRPGEDSLVITGHRKN